MLYFVFIPFVILTSVLLCTSLTSYPIIYLSAVREQEAARK
uniref:Uncharacterized protein n=1 Tax=Arundo donax TaxID=35708 RepID=A0A0A9B1W8_ARUDO